MAPSTYDLESKYALEEGQVYVTGVQALVRLPVDQMRADRRAGLNTGAFISGYPGSPMGRYDLELQRNASLLEAHGIVHQPGLNEELAATSVMGSQQYTGFGTTSTDGVLGIWYGKAPGVDRANDALRHGNFVGTTRHSGALVLVGDDPSCKSSSIPSASELSLADLAMPVMAPGNSQEVLDLGLHGIALSRASGLWVGVKIISAVADGAGTAVVGADRIQPSLPVPTEEGVVFGKDQPSPLSPAVVVEVEREMQEVRLAAARQYLVVNQINAVTHHRPRDRFGLIGVGHLYHELMEALKQLGLEDEDLARHGIRVLHQQALFPYTDGVVRTFASELDSLLVVEEKRDTSEQNARSALYGVANPPEVVGKRDEQGAPLVASFGAIDATSLLQPLYRQLSKWVDPAELNKPRQHIAVQAVAPPRTPYFCSGCPHNTSLKAPEGEYVGAGIGCHYMVAFLDDTRRGTVTGTTQMGGEGAQWIGAAHFVETGHFTQNLGDGTYFHSGQLAVQAAIAAGSNITFKILYNRAVAMTGGQAVPGELSVAAMAGILLAQGVGRIIVTTEDRARYRGVRLPRGAEVWDRHRIVEAQEVLRDHGGVTVLIHDQQCAAEARRLRKRGQQPEPTMRVAIAPRVCEGCGDCGVKSNCLSVQPVETEFGTKTTIDQSSCNRDYSCIDGDCPSFLTLQPATGRLARWFAERSARAVAARRATSATPVIDEEIAEPVRIVPADDYRVRMPGVGGTGVVTVAQVLGTAATLEGRHVAGLDQTGLAQKGGAVVSDLRISDEPLDDAAKMAPVGSADLYLALDLLVALQPDNLMAAGHDRTVAVVSTAEVPTGQMIGKPDAHFPPAAVMHAAIDERTRAERNAYLDPVAITRALFGRSTSANVFMVGVAHQLGALPMAAASIERALALNGVAVDANLQAFRWGRLWVSDHDRVEAALGAAERAAAQPDQVALELLESFHRELAPATADLVLTRISELVAFQDRTYAQRYLDTVGKVADAELRVRGAAGELTEAVATYLYKLMAYKDEYEVARLLLLDVDETAATAAAGDAMSVSFNLHPPMLRSMGILPRKMRLGPWARPVLAGLAGLKRLRGTKADPFGMTKIRRTERRLAADYIADMERAAVTLRPDTLATAVDLARLPDTVRGYEEVKMRTVERYQTEREALLEKLLAS